jgi:hypothetical protein
VFGREIWGQEEAMTALASVRVPALEHLAGALHPLAVVEHGAEQLESFGLLLETVRAARARLTIVHAFSSAIPWWVGMGIVPDWAATLRDRRSASARLLAGLRDEVPAEIPVVTRSLQDAKHADLQIADLVRTGRHDLIVLLGGEAAAGRLRRCASRIQSRSSVPVWRPEVARVG